MKVLVTGAHGQLERDLAPCLKQAGQQVNFSIREQMAFSFPSQVAEVVDKLRPRRVVNCAVFSKLDQAVSEVECAFRINRDSVAELARATAAYGGGILHLSTDYIFDGRQSTPYCEDDMATPINVYGRSRWEGDRCQLKHLPEEAEIHPYWFYRSNSHNFARTILRLAVEKESVQVVDDQMGSPTWTKDLANAITDLVKNGHRGGFHFTNEGMASWHEMTVAIEEVASRLGFTANVESLIPVTTEDFSLPAKRPHFSLLSKRKIRPLLSDPISIGANA